MRIKPPEEIARLRRSYEQSLEGLDDAEQLWAELSREQQVTEMFHATFCTGKHGNIYSSYDDYCHFEEEDWGDTLKPAKNRFMGKATGIIRAVPEYGLSNEQLGNLFAAIKKAVSK